MRGGAEGLPRPKPFNSSVFRGTSGQWHHDDPRATDDHRPEPGAWGPRHTHESDYERQERNWRMEELEKRHHLGEQFKRFDSDED